MRRSRLLIITAGAFVPPTSISFFFPLPPLTPPPFDLSHLVREKDQ